MAILKTYLLCILLLFPVMVARATTTELTNGGSPSASYLYNDESGVRAVWNNITLDEVNVHSRRGSELNLDCTRLGTKQVEVECFSIQQNFWVSDSTGNMVLWFQNVVQLAELQDAMFFATYAFFVWSPKDALQPLYCYPSALPDSLCRAPIYTDPIRFPHSFSFYANISRTDAAYKIYLVNSFAAISWAIPRSYNCPCFIDAVNNTRSPWGASPYEFVVVGLDSGATAFFANSTSGSISPGRVQLVEGDWHVADVGTLHCDVFSLCPTTVSTGERSANLRWDNDTGRIYWLNGTSDQGVYVTGIDPQRTHQPFIPNPTIESVLYIRASLQQQVVPTVLDEEGRATGYDSRSGGLVQNIPQSYLTLSGEFGIAIVNPKGSYRLRLTPIGSGPFHLLISKEFNVNTTEIVRTLNGTITLLTSEEYVIDSNPMTLNLSVNYGPTLVILGIVIAWVVVVVGLLLWLKRRRSSKGREDGS